jgi:hypothetical protein
MEVSLPATTKKLTVPLEDDIAVYARVLSKFYSRRYQENYALVVLAQRVLIERARVSKKAGVRKFVLESIEKVNSDPAYRAAMVAAGDASERLAGVYPQYLRAGLILNKNGGA